MNPYIIALIVLIAYIFLVYLLHKSGFLAKHGIRLVGPILMWRTTRGKLLIDKLSKPRRFWLFYSALAKIICIAAMIVIMALLIWEATIVADIPAERAPGPELLIGIPGINPIIPIGYGIVGLIAAIVAHEFAHGIMTRAGNMTVKSLGLLFLVVPLGAFVEPDEEELVRTEKKKRTSVYAAGPATNIVLALICAIIFSSLFVASATPVRPNPVVISVADDSPAEHAGLFFGSQIMRIGGLQVANISDIGNISAPDPGELVSVEFYYAGHINQVNITSGVVVTQTAPGLPAAMAGIKPGMIIASINDTIVRNESDFKRAMSLTKPYQTVNITLLAYFDATGTFEVFDEITEITLESKLEYYKKMAPELIGPDFKDTGYLGVNTAYIGATLNSPDVLLKRLAHPYAGVTDFDSFVSATLRYISLPFLGLAPLRSPLADLFVPGGVIAFLPTSAFWVIANCMYWVFWINLMVGLTNVLPAVPLDGGYLFKDWLDSVVRKLKKNATEREREKYIAAITYTLAFFVLALILWQIIGPRII
ncbi:MAG: site-2 protease family protein [Methanomassiliicoccales archaeon]|jgi:membrane-associated protease RseP (regulator of RpoE activity)|nr:site-2 protease family protein [Methanomassiliicoccales archaeon]